MPRILFDARPLTERSGGVSRVAARVLEHVRTTRPEAEIVTMTTGWKQTDNLPTTNDKRPLIHLHLPNKLWSLLCLFGITSLDREATRRAHKSFDELILPNIGFVGTPRIPYIIVVHDLSFLIEPKWFPWKMRLWHRAVRATTFIRSATNVWCVSETTARDVHRLLGVENERIIVLPRDVITGVGAGFARPDGTLPDSHQTVPADMTGQGNPAPTVLRTPRPYVLAFDGSPRKNISTAITAVERVRQDERFNNLQLVIVGGASDVRNAGVDWITHLPNISDTELDHLFANASALLYPSWYEGFGLPLHEAARFGIPILASIHGALPETAPPGTIFVHPAKPQLWVTALQNVL